MLSSLLKVKDLNNNDIESESLKPLYKKCISIAWPSTVEGALLSIIGSMDTMMVGRIGTAAIAAVGLTNQPRMILLILAQALCVGTTSLCARRKGAENRDGANSCLAQSLAIITVLGIMMTLCGYFGAPWLMRLAGANEDTMELSIVYFQTISKGMLFNAWSLCICAAFRAIGQTRITMITNISANIVNVVLNYILINGKLGFPVMGVKGAAVATFISMITSCTIAIIFLLQKNGYYSFTLPRFDNDTVYGLAKIGGSSILESAALRIGFLITSRMIAETGTNSFAAYQIVTQVSSLSFTLGDGISTAATSLIGQSLGANNKNNAMINARIAKRLGTFVAIGLMIFIFIFGRPLAVLFTDNEEVIYGVIISFYVLITGIIPQNGRVIYSGCLRGAGDVKYVALCALLSVTILRPAVTYLFCHVLNVWTPGLYFNVTGPWIAFVVDSYVRDLLLKKRINKAVWLDIKLK